MTQEMTLRVELFVDDLPQAIAFYHQILGFQYPKQDGDGYTPLTNGQVTIGLNLRVNLPADHPLQAQMGERLGRGVELVLEVNDIETMYAQVVATDWPLADQLQRQPWGLIDFRLVDPDGYYWRITSRSES